ncbi:hypothetical protein [Vibrio sp. Hep-1b-8]|uniref:hypothetical protein n=1 Tax=Vibrio sp. Hep-1b-8 TaxID=2144187 RepID=UPI0011103103|nr:hypothetical protein [Vibrio sp. Hep-1b-8]TMX36601.1 hypothetical protein DA100_12750 [Vibrio sp. Hep-1b-8]
MNRKITHIVVLATVFFMTPFAGASDFAGGFNGVDIIDSQGQQTVVFEGINYDGELRKVELPLDEVGKLCHKMAMDYLSMPKTRNKQILHFNVVKNRPAGTKARCTLKWGIAAG